MISLSLPLFLSLDRSRFFFSASFFSEDQSRGKNHEGETIWKWRERETEMNEFFCPSLSLSLSLVLALSSSSTSEFLIQLTNTYISRRCHRPCSHLFSFVAIFSIFDSSTNKMTKTKIENCHVQKFIGLLCIYLCKHFEKWTKLVDFGKTNIKKTATKKKKKKKKLIRERKMRTFLFSIWQLTR